VSRSFARQTAIVGIGATEFSKSSGRSELQLAGEAVRAAIADAGLSPQDVDGLTTFTMETNSEIEVAPYSCM
jgi:3-oxoacyl-[acyl-carrier-protein] synthase III